MGHGQCGGKNYRKDWRGAEFELCEAPPAQRRRLPNTACVASADIELCDFKVLSIHVYETGTGMQAKDNMREKVPAVISISALLTAQ